MTYMIVSAEIGGGEPFLYKDFKEMLKYMIAQDKIMTIKIPTNATILPDEECIELLKDEKIRTNLVLNIKVVVLD